MSTAVPSKPPQHKTNPSPPPKKNPRIIAIMCAVHPESPNDLWNDQHESNCLAKHGIAFVNKSKRKKNTQTNPARVYLFWFFVDCFDVCFVFDAHKKVHLCMNIVRAERNRIKVLQIFDVFFVVVVVAMCGLLFILTRNCSNVDLTFVWPAGRLSGKTQITNFKLAFGMQSMCVCVFD